MGIVRLERQRRGRKEEEEKQEQQEQQQQLTISLFSCLVNVLDQFQDQQSIECLSQRGFLSSYKFNKKLFLYFILSRMLIVPQEKQLVTSDHKVLPLLRFVTTFFLTFIADDWCHAKEFGLYLIENGKLLKDFKQRCGMIGFIFLKQHSLQCQVLVKIHEPGIRDISQKTTIMAQFNSTLHLSFGSELATWFWSQFLAEWMRWRHKPGPTTYQLCDSRQVSYHLCFFIR